MVRGLKQQPLLSTSPDRSIPGDLPRLLGAVDRQRALHDPGQQPLEGIALPEPLLGRVNTGEGPQRVQLHQLVLTTDVKAPLVVCLASEVASPADGEGHQLVDVEGRAVEPAKGQRRQQSIREPAARLRQND